MRRAGLALTVLLSACASGETPRARPASTPSGSTNTEAIGSEPGGAHTGVGACGRIRLPQDGLRDGVPRDEAKGQAELEKALALADAGDHTNALASFERATSADPYLGLAYLGAAESHLYTDNDPQRMQSLLTRAVHLLPTNPRAHLRFADLSAELGESERAEAHWRCALELRPDLLEARLRLGRALIDRGKHTDAEAELRRAATEAPNDIQARVSYADALEAQKKWLDAAREVEAAAALAGKSAPLFRRAAMLYESGGNLVAAKKAREAADKIDPPAKERKLRELPKSRVKDR